MSESAPTQAPLDLVGLSPEELEALVLSCGGRPIHAKRLLRGLHRSGLLEPGAVVPYLGRQLLTRLAQRARVVRPTLLRRIVSEDGTQRFALQCADGAVVEAVRIPDGTRNTLCISSQVGCALGCSFCRTGSLGLERNLSAGEILGQVALLRLEIEQEGAELTNVVFMGMGEPMANYEAVRRAVAVLIHDSGGHLPPRRVTVSTAGIPKGIQRLAEDFGGRVSLAISLTGTTDEQRDRLMPINRRYPLAELMAAARAYPRRPQRSLAFGVVLSGGETDREEDLERLIALLQGLRVKVNLIPFNEFPGCAHRAPAPAAVDLFFHRLNEAGLRTMIRVPRGREVFAACGQLAGELGASR